MCFPLWQLGSYLRTEYLRPFSLCGHSFFLVFFSLCSQCGAVLTDTTFCHGRYDVAVHFCFEVKGVCKWFCLVLILELKSWAQPQHHLGCDGCPLCMFLVAKKELRLFPHPCFCCCSVVQSLHLFLSAYIFLKQILKKSMVEWNHSSVVSPRKVLLKLRWVLECWLL